jgi:hypothetical protein
MKQTPDEKQIEELLENVKPTSSTRLNRRLSHAPWTQHAVNRRRFGIATVLVVLVAVSIVAATPQGRAWARGIIHQIGNFVITDEPSDAEKYVATLQSGTPTSTANPDWNPELVVSGLLTVSQASTKAGFPVYGPVYIPDGYLLSSRDVLFSDSSTTVDTSFRIELDPPLHDGLQMAGIIAISQTLVDGSAQPWGKGVGDTPIVEVAVREQPGIWLEQIPVTPFQDQNGQWDYERWNQLIWSEAGYTFMIQTNMPSDMLPLAELLKIAKSLTP